MSYTNFYIQNERRLPTPLAFIIVIAVTFAAARLSLGNLKQNISASQNEIQRLEIVNQSSTAATIYWSSQTKNSGWIIYGVNPARLDQTADDDRNLGETKNSFINHYATLKNLAANTHYYFKIISNNKVSSQRDGSPFTFDTFPVSKDASNLGPASGKVITSNSTALSNAIVLIKIKNAYTLAAYTKTQGDWIIPLNNIRNAGSRTLKIPVSEEKIKIEFFDEDGSKSTVWSKFSNISPLPEAIVIGRDYDFSSQNNVLSSATNLRPPKQNSIDLLFPKENAIIPSNKPLIKGAAIPNSKVKLTLLGNNTNINSTLITDDTGYWNFIPNKNLDPGSYSITIQTINKDNKDITLTKKFSIAKSGESVLGEATPDATITLSPTLTPIPSPTTPSEITDTPDVPAPPVTGANINAVSVAGISLITIGLGLLFIF